MNLDTVIIQLKTYAPLFDKRVAGGAEWDLTQDQVWLDPPAAYVIPLEDEVEPNREQTGIQQIVREIIAVVVVMDNSADRRGQTAVTSMVSTMRAQIWGALLGWRPPGENCEPPGFTYLRANYLRSDRSRLIWQFEMSLAITITEHDGFQIPSVPLTDIRGTVKDASTGGQLGVFDVTLPQS